jgi:hypothetical protein
MEAKYEEVRSVLAAVGLVPNHILSWWTFLSLGCPDIKKIDAI